MEMTVCLCIYQCFPQSGSGRIPMRNETVLKNWGLIHQPWVNMWCQKSHGRGYQICYNFKKTNLISHPGSRCTLYLACNDRKAFSTSTDHRGYTLWFYQNVCDALSYLLDNIYVRFGNKL